MKKNLAEKLLDDFPFLYRDRNNSSMQYGFACGDGWFDLIYRLSQDIEAVARESGLSPDSPEWPRCRQVKKKLGSLRFIVFANEKHRAMYDRINDLILTALNRSFEICEYCGKPGEIVTTHSISTLRQEHARQSG